MSIKRKNIASIFLLTGLLMSAACTKNSTENVNLFEHTTDIGAVKHAGSTVYDAVSQTFTLKGSGTNMWFSEDEFHMAWTQMSGDFLIRARVAFIGEGVDPHRKIGVIVRSNLETSSPYADVAVHGDGLTSLQYRVNSGDTTAQVQSEINMPDVIQLEKKGNTYTMSVAKFGEPFTTSERVQLELGDSLHVGIFICSHNPDVVEQAVFSNVRIVVPAADDFVPYRDYIGANLELLDVASGHRELLYQTSDAIQAPNWTPDGKTLIVNNDGKLYAFDLDGKSMSPINTGFATNNNNDHVLSFDGKLLGISHHAEDHDGQSVIYVLPVDGGTPQKVTLKSPSYLHGWSPDGKQLIYTGGRNNVYDIYKISVNGGDEVQLTDQPTLDDGSEYAPDGEHIYFNSARTGTMEIWRMKPDGSAQEQITDDPFNNWFPHISPDGKMMVMLSYRPEIDAGDHPWYKHVYIRTMPVDGSAAPKIIAYIYGGQGTINVPSWSPDGKKVAFVSNTQVR